MDFIKNSVPPMNDAEYITRTEQRLDSLLAVIEELNETISRKDAFIERMASHMAPIEAKYDEPHTSLSEGMQELVRAYRKAKEGI